MMCTAATPLAEAGQSDQIQADGRIARRKTCLAVLLLSLAVAGLLVPTVAQAKEKDPVLLVSTNAVVDFGGGVTSEWIADVVGNATTKAATGTFRGHTVGDSFDIDATGAVDCLNVIGSTAYLSGVITESNRADIPVGTLFYTSMTDGTLSRGPDIVGPTYLNPGFTCSNALAPEFVVTSGSVGVQTCDKVNGSGKCKTRD